MHPIGISQLIAGNRSTEEFLVAARDNGYEAVELSLRPQGGLTPQTTPAELDAIAERARALGLTIASVTLGHCTGNLLATGADQETSITQTAAGLEMAARLGAPVALHTLGRLSPDLYYDDAYRHAVAALRRLAPTAERLGVAIAFEFVWNGFLFSPMEVARFLDEVGSPAVGFYFDPGNMAVFQFPHHWVRIVGRRIKRVHLKDWKGNALNGGWTPLQEGAVDFARVMAELRAAGYTGPLISEVPESLATLSATADAIRRIRAL
ncbi:MAG: sugar phosphate isomerase/epimerase [Lentisphaerae bacterium]|nr:sugar phosphate isomerase/epimerase [Lentisphaerota bacterium]